MKRSTRGGQSASLARKLNWSLLAAAVATGGATFAFASPQGGEVVQGSATISTPTSVTTQIDQSSDKAVINWQSFNVGQDEKAIFNQPTAASVTLNRIFDRDPSIIAGLVTANGRLILINANGMVFENGASVNTAGLIATTADISNGDFMAGNYRFETPGAAGASIVNKGMITADEGGVVAFVAPTVRNSGVITAKLGRVALGAGNTFVLDLYGDNLISFPVSAEIAEQLTGPDGKPLSSLIDVAGKIEAGSVQLSARAARGIIDNVISVDGEIIASGVKQSSTGATYITGGAYDPSMLQNDRAAGRVDALDGGTAQYGGVSGTYGGRILIDGGANGTVAISGRLDASSATGEGGRVNITGRNILLDRAKIDASGKNGGGEIAVGFSGDGATRTIGADGIIVTPGTTLKADTGESGDGGRIVFWSNLATDFYGSLSAKGGASSGDGGFLEVSSKDQVGFAGVADASAANGEAGRLLLDPKNITVFIFGGTGGVANPNLLTFANQSTSSLTISPNFLTTTLNTGTAVTLQANNDITILSSITANNPGGNGGALTLQAGRSVFINANITTDNGNLTIIANELLAAGVVNAQRDPGSAVLTMAAGTSINAGTGAVRLAILSGAGKTQLASGDVTLRSITGSTIRAENLGTTAGSDVIIASGTLNASGAGTPLVVASQSGTFTNNAGAGALQTPNGRWLVYTNTPAATGEGGLAGTPFYNTVYNPANPTGVSAPGNKFAYSLAANLTVTPNNASRVYGDPNPAFTYAIAGLQAGDTLAAAVQGAPAITSLAGAASSVAGSPYAITASLGTLASNYNYGFTFAPGQLAITPAQLLYLATPTSREYGDPNVLTGTLAGLKNGETAGGVTTGALTFTSLASNVSPVGSYAIVGSGLTVTSGNYAATILQNPSNATALTVVPAQLFYLATPSANIYGDLDLDVEGVVAGLKNGDDPADAGVGDPIFTTTVTATSGVGQYGIFGSGLVVNNPNYAATVLQDPSNATAYTVSAAQLFYSSSGLNREYGDPNPALVGSLEGLVNGDALEAVVSGTLVFSTAATETSNVGSYAIDGSGLTVINANYAVTILQDIDNAIALEITPAPLTYLAGLATRIYGDANQTFTGTVVGLKNGETLEQVTDGTQLFLSPATPLDGVGEYGIFGEGLAVTSGNYFATIAQDTGNATALEILPAQLTYVADPKSKVYGQLIPTLTGTVQGLKNGEALETVTAGTLVWETDADETSEVGIYAINGDGLVVVSPNYDSTIEQAPSNLIALTINQAQLVYLADPKFRLFGFVNPELTGQLVGLTNDDQIEDVTAGTLVFTTAAVQYGEPGLYDITGSGLTVTNNNYIATIVQDPGNATALEVKPIPLTTVQAQGESALGNESATDQEQNDMSSRPSELGIVGVGPVSDDLADGKTDDLAGQLCVLGAPEAANHPSCRAMQREQ